MVSRSPFYLTLLYGVVQTISAKTYIYNMVLCIPFCLKHIVPPIPFPAFWYGICNTIFQLLSIVSLIPFPAFRYGISGTIFLALLIWCLPYHFLPLDMVSPAPYFLPFKYGVSHTTSHLQIWCLQHQISCPLNMVSATPYSNISIWWPQILLSF